MATRLLIRAWYVAHRGPQALVAGLGVAVLFAAFGASSISIWGSVRQIPLWAFVPGTLVLIAGTTWDGRLDAWPAVREPPGRVARALWVVLVLLVATVLAVPTAVALDNPVIVTTTAVLAIASFGPALVDVRLAVVVGGGVDLAALLLTRRLDANNSVALFLETMPGWIWMTLVGTGVVGIAGYVWSGPRKIGGRVTPG